MPDQPRRGAVGGRWRRTCPLAPGTPQPSKRSGVARPDHRPGRAGLPPISRTYRKSQPEARVLGQSSRALRIREHVDRVLGSLRADSANRADARQLTAGGGALLNGLHRRRRTEPPRKDELPRGGDRDQQCSRAHRHNDDARPPGGLRRAVEERTLERRPLLFLLDQPHAASAMPFARAVGKALGWRQAFLTERLTAAVALVAGLPVRMFLAAGALPDEDLTHVQAKGCQERGDAGSTRTARAALCREVGS